MIRFSYIISSTFLLIAFFSFSGCFPGEEREKHYKPTIAHSKVDELVVGIHPYLNAEKTFLVYGPILRYLEDGLGKTLRLETSLDYADYERKLYSRYFDISLPNPYQTITAVEQGYKIIAKVKPDSEFKGLIVARKDHHIRFVEQLRGKPISFPAPTALAATLMPKWFLYEHGLNVEKDSKPRYVGSQYSSIMNAYDNDTVVAATWPSPWKTWQVENPKKAIEMEVVWETPSLVNNSIVVKSDMEESVSNKLTQMLIHMHENLKGRNLLAPSGFSGFEKADNHTYEPVKNFLNRYDQAIGLPK